MGLSIILVKHLKQKNRIFGYFFYTFSSEVSFTLFAKEQWFKACPKLLQINKLRIFNYGQIMTVNFHISGENYINYGQTAIIMR